MATLRDDALACYRAGVAAVEPGRAVARRLIRVDDVIVLRDEHGRVCARHDGRVVIVAAGKAAAGMANAATAILGARCGAGMVIGPYGASAPVSAPLEATSAGHPVPDTASLAATARVLDLIRQAGPRALILVLLSGGASAMLEAPAGALTLADLQALTRALLVSGVDIHELNVVRKHCSLVKGGGLARAASGAAGIWTLVLSDVVGDDLATIASGPTVADATTYAEALAVLDRHGVAAPPTVRRHLELGVSGGLPETARSEDRVFARAQAVCVGSNADAVSAAAAEAQRRGYAVTRWPAPIVGDAEVAARAVVQAVRALDSTRPAAWIGGGETTVRVRAGGVGGRSQHLALAAATELQGEPVVLLAAGTDGIDGPTDAAGGMIDGETVRRATACGLDSRAVLDAMASHRLLAATGDLVVTGPTGTNVADIVVALRVPA